MTDETTADLVTAVAVLTDRVETMGKSVDAVHAELTLQRTVSVPRSEWEMRNRHVDDTFRSIGREVGDLRTEMRSRRVSWPSVGALAVAACALGLSVVERIAT